MKSQLLLSVTVVLLVLPWLSSARVARSVARSKRSLDWNAHEKRELGASYYPPSKTSSRFKFNRRRPTGEAEETDVNNCQKELLTSNHSTIECNQYSGCRATCDEGYKFPTERTSFMITCVNGVWNATGTNYTYVPDCVPTQKAPEMHYEKIEKLGGSYKLHTNLLTWEQARQDCSREGAHLAIINSQDEAEVLMKIFASHPKIADEDQASNEAYIGVNDLAEKGHFVTIFGQPLSATGYARWEKNEPNDASGHDDCVAILREGTLNDEPCDIKLPFFCEKKI